MEDERPGQPTKRGRPRVGLISGSVFLGVLVIVGLFIWPVQLRPTNEDESRPAVSRAARVVPAQPATSTLALSATNPPEPATPTTIPTSANTTTVEASFPEVQTAVITATTIPTVLSSVTPVINSAAVEQLPASSLPAAPAEVTSRPTATAIPWPTINPVSLPKPPSTVDTGRTHLWFSRPVDGSNVPSSAYRFGMTFNQRLVPHRGVDIANDEGVPVVAVGPGTVLFAGEDQEVIFGPQPAFYGQLVVIEMDQRWEGHVIYALYGHLTSTAATSGQRVNQGDEIGAVGSSGVALASHLHFEVRQNDPYSYDSVRNPELWYWPFSGRGVLAGRVIDARGYFLPGTRVNVDCRDGAPRYVETYWDLYTSPDDILMENFAISDLPAGSCRVWSDLFDEVVEEIVEINPGELSTVVLQARR